MLEDSSAPPMLRENLGLAMRSVAIGALTTGLYLAFGWVGVAALALIELGEITTKLGDIAERVPR